MKIQKSPNERSLPMSADQECTQSTVLVLDASGSMEDGDYPPSRLHAGKSSAQTYLDERATLSPNDRIAVVSYGTVAQCHCELEPVRNTQKIAKAIARIGPGGLTAMGDGLQRAAMLHLGRHASGPFVRLRKWLLEGSPSSPVHFLKRVILLTDGHHCHGVDPLPVAERLKGAGVQIDCIGIGGSRETVDESLLRSIASIDQDTGQPRYRFISDKNALQTHFRKLATSITR